jgi:hypothetical protein
LKDSLKDLIYGKKIKSFKVLSPLRLLAEEDDEEAAAKLLPMFSEDPVHLSDEGYDEIVTKLLSRTEDNSFTRVSNPRLPSANSGGVASTGQHLRRQRWVAEDDTYAHRDYRVGTRRSDWNSQRGRGRGGGDRGARHYRGRGGSNWRGNPRGKTWGRGSYKKRTRPY